MSDRKPSSASLKICHLSDINLGYRRYNKVTKAGFNQREADVAIAFREAIDRVIKIKPNLVVIAGDLFWSVRPSNAVLSQAFGEVRRLSSCLGAPIVIVAGNRESPRRSDTGSPLRLLAEISGVHVVDSRAQTLRFDELSLSVCCIPHNAVADSFAREIRADDSVLHNILITHGQVPGAVVSDSGGALLDIKNITTGEWDYVALGHSHLYSRISDNVVYSGATERTAADVWSMAHAECGFVEVELPAVKVRFHQLTSVRNIAVLEPIDADGASAELLSAWIHERVAGVVNSIFGKIVRLTIKNVSLEASRGLDYKQIRKYRADALNFSLELHPVKVKQVIKGENRTKERALSEEIREFAKDWGKSPGDSLGLSNLVEEYLRKIESDNEANQSEA